MHFLIGLVISGFLFLLLCFKKKKNRADYILTTWIGVLTLHLFLHHLHFTEIIYQYPHALGLIFPLPLLHGVLLYLYTLELTKERANTLVGIAKHLIPFLVLILAAIPFYRLSASEKIGVFLNEGEGFEWYIILKFIAIIASGFLYSIASIVQIHKYRKQIRSYLSNTDKVLLRWLEYLSIGLAVIWGLVLFFDDNIIFTGVVVFVLYIGFSGINQLTVFTMNDAVTISEPIIVEDTKETINETVRYAKSGLKEEDATAIFESIEKVMHSEKMYINSELTLNDVAARLELHPNKLSQVINSMTGNSFYHYVNIYRIKEFLEVVSLPKNQHLTFFALAYDCGFNSKSTFNKYFKLHTGKTPSEYLKK